MKRFLAPLLVVVVMSLIAGCAAKPLVDRGNIDKLALEIQALGPEVDPEEAHRAARIAYDHSLQLAEEWQVTDPPLIHNAKVLHAAVISRRGDTLYEGIVLDPWRYGGVLFWSKTEEDSRYDWGPPL